MKTHLLFQLIFFFVLNGTFAQKKSGIIQFNFRGLDRQENYSASSGSAEMPRLYFVYDNSTRIDSQLTSDIMLRHTEKALREFLGYELIPAGQVRNPNVPDQVEGALWAMETITEKNAFSKLGYEEVIKVDARIYSGSSKNGKHTPTIEVSVKVIGQDGKASFKNSEKLKLKEEQIPESDLIIKDGNESLSISDGIKLLKKGGKVELVDNSDKIGVPGAKLFDWYQQCLSNVLIRK